MISWPTLLPSDPIMRHRSHINWPTARLAVLHRGWPNPNTQASTPQIEEIIAHFMEAQRCTGNALPLLFLPVPR